MSKPNLQPTSLPIEKYLLPAGLWLAWIGYFQPWIQHPAAALRMTGYQLAEWVRLLPGVQLSQLPFQKMHFRLPLSAVILLSASWAFEPGWKSLLNGKEPALWWRRLALLAALAGTLSLLPGYPNLVDWQADPTAPQNIRLAIFTLLGVGVLPFLRKLPARWFLLVEILLALGAFGLNWWLMLGVLPPIGSLYGKLPAIGWGWMMFQSGMLLLFVAYLARRVWLYPLFRSRLAARSGK